MAKLKIIETNEFKVVEEHLSKTNSNSLVLLDVDDTIITPISAMFAGNSKYRFFIDELKKNSHKCPNFEQMLENFRLTRKVKLIDNNWRKLINQIKINDTKIYALTQLSGDKVGENSLKQWRYQELSNLAINFTDNFEQASDLIIIEEEEKYPALFYKGIFITGSSKKGAVVAEILKKISPAEIIFVDDRLEHINDLAAVCASKAINYLGIHYTGAQKINAEINQNIVALQQKLFTEQGKWLEDDEACNLLNAPIHY